MSDAIDNSEENSNSNSYSPIQCHLYDYIEIACMRHYMLDILLTSGEVISGKAITTCIKDKQEFIVLNVKSGIENAKKITEKEIRLDSIKEMSALDDNAEFGTVTIS